MPVDTTPTEIKDEQKLNLINALPKEIIEVMYDLHESGMYARLAGGAVRDGLLGKPIKDFDFYFDYIPNSKDNYTKIVGQFSKVLRDWNFAPCPKIPEYDDNFLVIKMYKMPTGSTKNIQCDMIFSGQKISEFDHAICQCSLEITPKEGWKIETTTHFDTCIRNKMHVVYEKNLHNAAMCNKSIRDHTPRIRLKYPWPVFINYE